MRIPSPRLQLACWRCVSLPLCVFFSSSLFAETCDQRVGHVTAIEGNIELQRVDSNEWSPATLNDDLCQGDTIRAAAYSRAAVVLINEAVLRIDQNSALKLLNISGNEEKRSFLSLLAGAFQSFSRKPRSMEIDTPYLNGSIEGTEFTFRIEENRTLLTVFEGRVLAANDFGQTSVSSGESVTANEGNEPISRAVITPRDAAQWSLYYPPVLTLTDQSIASVVSLPTRAAIERGDMATALSLMSQSTESEQTADFHLYRAALFYSVGRIAEANEDIARALDRNPGSGLAYALRAVSKVTGNETEKAVEDAQQAVVLNPDSASSYIALSYALQSQFRISEARDSLLQAVTQQPEHALAWARLSELQLMLGLSEQAIRSATEASALEPDLARTRISTGFANLSAFRNQEAKESFTRAIQLDSADPLPRLGLGLAKISSGQLSEGRADIEVAVALDSNNALYRTYLGKAYFEETRSPLDEEQYDVAKQLDPNDPTAYLYNAIRLQTKNKPVEALVDLEASMARNDARAPYRSRFLLDKDRAARGTSLGRLYNDLGFVHLGVRESSTSLNTDPANSSAHRFLSDSYRGIRRHEIARVSELLQSQLFQEININPVQPSIAETNLNIVTLGGPAAAGFNEFTPLYARNKSQFNFSGFAGNHHTGGGEAVWSGLYGRGSFSLGAFTYDSDGWRNNNDVNRDLFNFYGQLALTSRLNIQTEIAHQESRAGDLAFKFDPQIFLEDKSDEREQLTARIGLRYLTSPRSSLIVSWIHNDRDEVLSEFEQIDPLTTQSIDSTVTDKGDQLETRYDGSTDSFSYIIGASFSDVERDIRDQIEVVDADAGPVLSIDESFSEQNEHAHGYIYVNLPTVNDSVHWTFGASFDDYEEGIFDESGVNPKIGLTWQASDTISVRAAALKVMKPSLVNNRTVEPTQLAGFNQFFDDINGTTSTRYGVGIDQRVGQSVFWGSELTFRDLDEPNFLLFEDPPTTTLEERREQQHKIYFYWTPRNDLSITAELNYDLYEAESGEATEFGNLPEEVETISAPIGINYFHPSGFFASITGTYVDQEVKRAEFSTHGEGQDSFFTADMALGYRLSKRRGTVSLGIRNIFDEEFSYQDDSYREFRGESSTGPYFPATTVLGQVSFNF